MIVTPLETHKKSWGKKLLEKKSSMTNKMVLLTEY